MSKALWEQNSSQFFIDTTNLYKLHSRARGGIQIKILLRSDQRPFHIFFLEPRIFGVSKLLWAYNGFKFIFRRFFRLYEIGSKGCFKLAGISFYAQKLNGNQKIGSLWGVQRYTKQPKGYQFYHENNLHLIIIRWLKRFCLGLEANGRSICLSLLPPLIHW